MKIHEQDWLERLLQNDAQQNEDPPEIQVEIALLSPKIAKEATRLRHRRKQRRESMIMAGAIALVLVLAVCAMVAFRLGDDRVIAILLGCAGVLGAMALLTMPLIEKFKPHDRHR